MEIKDYLIDFENTDWEVPMPGVRQKVCIRDDHKIRLVEFTEEFVEEDWCIKGHTGYILEGNISIDFNGEMLTFKQGDALFIPGGEESKHKARIAGGERALLILFENA